MTLRLPLLTLLLLLLVAPFVSAHEVGDSQIVVEPGDTTWTARIVTGPTALINRLEQAAGRVPSRDLTPEQAAQRLADLASALPEHLRITIDGMPVPATLTVEQLSLPVDQAQPAWLVLRAEGPLPAGATRMTWQFDLLAGQTPLLLAGQTHWVQGGSQTGPLPLHPGPPPGLMPVVVATAVQYLHLGFIHILPNGPDHVLFVLGLLLLTTKLPPLLVQVTAFTVAHCLTLVLALYGVIDLPSQIVEPLIALSIAYVAVENIFVRRLTPWRPVLVFTFGLLHGLGFAGVLADLGLPAQDRVTALIAFNLGIEGGQLAVIALAYGLVLHWFKDRPWYHARLVTPASAAIALVGLYWTAERALA
ncbi:MAG: HupE/UreJ family protein [Niveispirillum sp.]|uniref:HupE/UreJ family protein n=1 Tax=Niveispirillum sp. TaxID=1917217 RepID=UPI003BA79B63